MKPWIIFALLGGAFAFYLYEKNKSGALAPTSISPGSAPSVAQPVSFTLQPIATPVAPVINPFLSGNPFLPSTTNSALSVTQQYLGGNPL